MQDALPHCVIHEIQHGRGGRFFDEGTYGALLEEERLRFDSLSQSMTQSSCTAG